MEQIPATLMEVLEWRALNSDAHRLACQFLDANVSDVAKAVQGNSWSYWDLDRRARAIGNYLQSYLPGQISQQPVILAYAPGLEFIAALFGCWYAGAIAVPVQPAKRHQSGERWRHILDDANAVGVLTTLDLLPQVKQLTAHQTAVDTSFFHLATDAPSHQTSAEESNRDLSNSCLNEGANLALLQYTSGSTSQPKGVMVSHDNLINNLATIHQRFGHSADSHGVIWLPPHHDMGLIGGILQPIYGGFPVTLMPPESFLRQPIRWLQAISHFRATTSGGPDFAYNYCLQKTTPEQRSKLDLSSWQVAFTGAEPVKAKTLSDFATTFAECGFKAEAFYPCYGLAEATLFVSGEQHRDIATKSRSLSRAALGQGTIVDVPSTDKRAVSVVSCGNPDEGTKLVVVDPVSSEPCPSGQVGEIWFSGASVAQGYWQNPTATQESFKAYLFDGNGPYLRTGDLGFYDGQDLYVTGRLKDLIVIRGQNHLPQDIEQTVAQIHPDLRQQSAAFSTERDGQECLAIFQEVERKALRRLDSDVIFSAIRAAVSKHHGLQPAVIWLLKPSQLPQTTSGKVQRHVCKAALQGRTLEPVAEWSLGMSYSGVSQNPHPQKTNSAKVKPLLSWLRSYARESINSQLMDERRCISPGVILDLGTCIPSRPR
ncbi:MAG: fatty acyl-AMP ligase, partial [Cyanobacteria bacterium J06642_11]